MEKKFPVTSKRKYHFKSSEKGVSEMGSWIEELLEEGEKRVTVLVSYLIRDNRIEE